MLYKRIEKYGLCPRDLNRQIAIYSRTLGACTPDVLEPQVELTLIGNFMCAIETISPFAKLFGVNIKAGTTHVVYLMLSQRIKDLEVQKTYMKLGDSYYKLNASPMNFNEGNRFLIMEFEKRGLTTNKEALA